MDRATKRKASKLIKLRPEILAHPNIPKPLHGTNPRSILGKEWWDKERHAAFKLQEDHCIACGVHKSDAKYHKYLEGHEYYKFDYINGTATYVETVGLCHMCHCYIHSGLLQINVNKKKCTRGKQKRVLDHGDSVLINAGLDKYKYNGPMAPWPFWRLIINGKKYKGKFPTKMHWRSYYRRVK